MSMKDEVFAMAFLIVFTYTGFAIRCFIEGMVATAIILISCSVAICIICYKHKDK